MQPSLFIGISLGISYNGADVCKKMALIMLRVINPTCTCQFLSGNWSQSIWISA